MRDVEVQVGSSQPCTPGSSVEASPSDIDPHVDDKSVTRGATRSQDLSSDWRRIGPGELKSVFRAPLRAQYF